MENKFLLSRSAGRIVVGLLTLVLGLVATQGSSFLLRVDTSDASAVTITATGEFSEVQDYTTDTWDGVTLLGFFTKPESGGGALSFSTLQAANTGETYNSWWIDGHSGQSVDLNLYLNTGSASQIFTTSQSAFTGTATLDLSGYSFRGAGATGSILAGYSGNPGAVIGQYVIVPEPHALPIVAGLGLVAFTWIRRYLGR